MSDFNEQSHLAEALRRLEKTKDPRVRQVMEAFTKHMFAFINEVAPSEEEWMTGIQFLTEVGQMCDDVRQEWILFSDSFGVSMLVDYHAHKNHGDETESSVLGPFYRLGAPELKAGQSISQDGIGDPVLIEGKVTGPDREPIAGAKVEVWQTAPNGFYEVQDENQPEFNLRGTFVTDAKGDYKLRTVKPVSYPIPDDGPVGKLLNAVGRHPYRPAHIHFMVSAKNCRTVVTQLFTDDDKYLTSDAVFGVKDSLVVQYHPDAEGLRVNYNFTLSPAS